MSGKKYNQIREKAPKDAVGVKEAIDFVLTNKASNFDETIELHIHLGIDPGKSDQIVRGTVQLPSGTPSKKVVAVFTSDTAKQKEAKDAGATIIGGEELIDKVAADGDLAVEVAIATPDMMPKLAKIARVLGPKGLMPNPKTGTVTPDVGQAVTDISGGKITFKMDQLGNIHESVGKMAWESEKILANVEALLEAVRAARPVGAKGELVKSATICSTMGPGVSVATK